MTTKATTDSAAEAPQDTPDSAPGDEAPKPVKSRARRSSGTRSRRSSRRSTTAASGEKSDRKPRSSGSRQPSLAKQLEPMFALAGVGMAAKCQPCGAHMIEQAPATAKALADYAKTRPGVERTLRRLLTVSDTGLLVTALAGYVMVPLAHHGVIPAPLASVAGMPTMPQAEHDHGAEPAAA